MACLLFACSSQAGLSLLQVVVVVCCLLLPSQPLLDSHGLYIC
jgi:hypothetical protein